ncbi:MAG: hypothetical protein LQ351_004774 [Letrouitia transgressa]|nr:MAG: hypothetical protein LQ351_004774 [Letrouitia transgressa]
MAGQPQRDEVPDPDEDGLDDLDDILDEFVTKKNGSQKAAQANSATEQKPSSPKASEVDASSCDFDEQLQRQMAALLGEADESPEMKKDIEAIMRELGAAADVNADSEIPNDARDKSAEVPFDQKIRQTMERIQNSGEQATAAAASQDSDDLLDHILREMQSGDLGAAGNEEEFSKILTSMMEHLTNKDILYDPMKELHTKFPPWMDQNRANAAPGDLKRYEAQQILVKEIVNKFEEKTYSDSNAKDREYIVERMQQASSRFLLFHKNAFH